MNIKFFFQAVEVRTSVERFSPIWIYRKRKDCISKRPNREVRHKNEHYLNVKLLQVKRQTKVFKFFLSLNL